MFALRARRAGLRVIPLRNTRHTCSSLLVALKVHPKEVCAEASEGEMRDAIGKLSDATAGTGCHGCCTSLLYAPTAEAPGMISGGLWPAVHSAGFEPATF